MFVYSAFSLTVSSLQWGHLSGLIPEALHNPWCSVMLFLNDVRGGSFYVLVGLKEAQVASKTLLLGLSLRVFQKRLVESVDKVMNFTLPAQGAFPNPSGDWIGKKKKKKGRGGWIGPSAWADTYLLLPVDVGTPDFDSDQDSKPPWTQTELYYSWLTQSPVFLWLHRVFPEVYGLYSSSGMWA